ncbi:Gfo/Idh/MocA family protein [Aestuariimicrobium ganziense]|uniref:Gfo/Idh/MocA family protein n=1 Tax=Aestuariimicrobium ganziense TaxID=2773677 RepID=UPI0019428BC8|nr:Gfo/Idh/MocA family oxidoreductase [Aestuariimicrobium ganziense]
MSEALRVAMVGHAFMGRMHTQAWKTAGRFFDLPRPVECTLLVGRDGDRAAQGATRLEWAESSDDWRTAVTRDDIDIVDICTPGDSHAEIAIAALAAGKHVMCEKPLATTLADATRMADAARAALEQPEPARSMCGFSYRLVPALTHARDLVGAGRLGEILQVRGRYLQDWLTDPQVPWSWRLDKDIAGSGALGDIGAHIIDAAEYVTGLRVSQVAATVQTFVHERPVADSASALGRAVDGSAPTQTRPVTVDDAALLLARFTDADGRPRPTTGNFEATRVATGRKNGIHLEVNGTLGSIFFDFEDMNTLQFYDASVSGTEQGFTRILVTQPDHPFTGHWWPTGHGLGYEHGFVHQVVGFVQAICDGTQPRPSFDDALHIQQVLDAVERSAGDDACWTPVGPGAAAAN